VRVVIKFSAPGGYHYRLLFTTSGDKVQSLISGIENLFVAAPHPNPAPQSVSANEARL